MGLLLTGAVVPELRGVSQPAELTNRDMLGV